MQKFYFANTAPTNAPTTGEKSTALPVGTFVDTVNADRALRSAVIAGGQISAISTTLAQTAHQDCYDIRFSSEALGAGTYGSGNWTLAINGVESNISANMFYIASIYFWRPSNSSVVGFVYDSDTHLSTEIGNNSTNKHGKVITLAGSNVTIVAGDVLVIEIWIGGSQASATSYTARLHYNGSTDPTAASTEVSSSSYLSAPVNLPNDCTIVAKAASSTSAKATFSTKKGHTAKVSTSSSSKAPVGVNKACRTNLPTSTGIRPSLRSTRPITSLSPTATSASGALSTAPITALAATLPISTSATVTTLKSTLTFTTSVPTAAAASAIMTGGQEPPPPPPPPVPPGGTRYDLSQELLREDEEFLILF